MTDILIILAAIYVIIVLCVGAVYSLVWNEYRHLGKRYAEETAHAANRVLLSPFWPIIIWQLFQELRADARGDK